jgi:hypothetical protein
MTLFSGVGLLRAWSIAGLGLAVFAVGAMMVALVDIFPADTSPPCPDKSKDELIEAVNRYWAKSLRNGSSALAKNFAEHHLFLDRDISHTPGDGANLWGVPFLTRDPRSGRIKKYTAIVRCDGAVEIVGPVSSSD